MTRTGPAKDVDDGFVEGRRSIARAYRNASQEGMALLQEGFPSNPVISQMVNTVIAYMDVISAHHSGKKNQQNHQASGALLRAALGNALPKAELRRAERILKEKDAAQYGAKPLTGAFAASLFDDMEKFCDWAERMLPQRPSPTPRQPK